MLRYRNPIHDYDDDIDFMSPKKLDISGMDWDDSNSQRGAGFLTNSAHSPSYPGQLPRCFSEIDHSRNFFTGRHTKNNTLPVFDLSGLNLSDSSRPNLSEQHSVNKQDKIFTFNKFSKELDLKHSASTPKMFINGKHTFFTIPSSTNVPSKNALPPFNVLKVPTSSLNSPVLPNSESMAMDSTDSKNVSSDVYQAEVCFQKQKNYFLETKRKCESEKPSSDVRDTELSSNQALQPATRSPTKKHNFLKKTIYIILLAVLIPCAYFFVTDSYPDIFENYIYESKTNETCINLELLEKQFNSHVFGQHLAIESILNSLREFLNNKTHQMNENIQHKKTLVLLFQGWTGVGKSHTSRIISSFLPSDRVHHLIVGHHFTGHDDEAKLQTLIGDVVSTSWLHSLEKESRCPRLFVIDELDDAQPPLIEGLLTIINKINSNEEDGNNKVIFILHSKVVGPIINKIVFDALTVKNISRGNIDMNMFTDNQDIQKAAGESWSDNLSKKDIAYVFVPFLPLEKIHVQSCVKQHLIERNFEVSQQLIEDVSQSMIYFPDHPGIFSVAGCRKVPINLDLLK